jgi:hypothetical protein
VICRQINISQRVEQDVAHNFLIGRCQHPLEDFDGGLGPVNLLVHIDLLKERHRPSGLILGERLRGNCDLKHTRPNPSARFD